MSSRKSQDETAGMLSAPHSFESEGMAFDVRPGFIRKVYGILTAQLVLTFGLIFVMVFVEPVRIQMCGGVDNLAERGGCKEPTDTLNTALITSCVLSFVFLCAISCCGSLARKVPHNYILLFCFTLCEAIMLGIMCLFFDAVSVGLATLMTALVTAGLTAYACKTTTDFTGMGCVCVCFGVGCTGLVCGCAMSRHSYLQTELVGIGWLRSGYLFAALLTLMVCGLVGGMFSVSSVFIMTGCSALCLSLCSLPVLPPRPLSCSPVRSLSVLISAPHPSVLQAFYGVGLMQNIYAGFGCLIFSFYIVYDTQLIVGGKHAKHQFGVDDYVFAVRFLSD